MHPTTVLESLNTIITELSDGGIEFERLPKFFYRGGGSAFIFQVLAIDEKEVTFMIVSSWDRYRSRLVSARKCLYDTMTVQEYQDIVCTISGTMSITIETWNTVMLPQFIALAVNHMQRRTER